MARDQRLKVEGGSYHVMNRGNRKVVIFQDDRDRRRFARILSETSQTYQVELLSGALMATHFHLVVRTPAGNVSEFMQQLEGQYAQYSNWRHGNVGHLFQDRFKGVIIENDIHLFTAFWYVAMNPVVARLVQYPEEWKWSTYSATVGLSPAPAYLSLEWVSTLFPSDSLADSQRLCLRCMRDPQPVQAYLQAVEPTTAAAVRSYISQRLNSVSQPCSYAVLTRPPLEHLFAGALAGVERESAIATAHERHQYKLVEVARFLGVHHTTVSRIYCKIRRRRRVLTSGSDLEVSDDVSHEMAQTSE